MAKELTRRELQVARLTAEGLSAAGIAGRLGLKASTVHTYRANAYAKTRTGTAASMKLWLAAQEGGGLASPAGGDVNEPQG